MIVDKAKKAGLSTIFDIMDQVFPMVTTSVSKTEILKMIPTVIGYSIDETTGFPLDYKFATVKGSVIVPDTLESNVLKVHQFLYGKDVSQTPSSVVNTISAEIDSKSALNYGESSSDETDAGYDAGTSNSYYIDSGTDYSQDSNTGYDNTYTPDTNTGYDNTYTPDTNTGGNTGYDDGTGGGTTGGDTGYDDGSGGSEY